MDMKGRSVCYANASLLLRRPISELLQQQEGHRKVGLLIPTKDKKRDESLHHSSKFKNVEMLTYHAFHPPGQYEWPIPGPRFFLQAWHALKTYDVIHLWAHFYPSNFLLVMKSLFFPKTKIILTMDTLPGYSFKMGGLMDTLFKIYTWTLGRLMYGIPDTITLYGKALLPHAKASGINMKKVKVIPTGINPYTHKNARKKIEREFKHTGKIVFFAGLLNPRKRVHQVLEVAEQFPGVLFLVAGDGPQRHVLIKSAKEKKLNVQFLGWRKDIHDLLEAADVLLFPSSAEGLPGIVMEAMTVGTPVVSTNIPCTVDLLAHGKEGLLCPVDDITGMVKNVRTLLEDPEKAKKIAAEAKRKIQQYDWKKILKQYEELYKVRD